MANQVLQFAGIVSCEVGAHHVEGCARRCVCTENIERPQRRLDRCIISQRLDQGVAFLLGGRDSGAGVRDDEVEPFAAGRCFVHDPPALAVTERANRDRVQQVFANCVGTREEISGLLLDARRDVEAR